MNENTKTNNLFYFLKKHDFDKYNKHFSTQTAKEKLDCWST